MRFTTQWSPTRLSRSAARLCVALIVTSAVYELRAARAQQSEFIFEQAPFAQCHASTIVETPYGLVSAWFGGTDEGNPDVGIWLSRREGTIWTAPVEVANGKSDGARRWPCWNPVLFQPRKGPLLLFYKVGRTPGTWWGMLMTSADGGRSWSSPRRLPQGILGPTKNKPIQLADGTILCPSSREVGGNRTVHIESTRDDGITWETSRAIEGSGKYSAIQPAILRYAAGEMQLLCRSLQGKIVESWSRDEGQTWSKCQTTALPNPDSGIDALMLRDGRAVVVYNHAARSRKSLDVAISPDGSKWQRVLQLENGDAEYSYPTVIQTGDGLIHITYTWKRQRIKHVVLNPLELISRERSQ